MNLEEYVSQVVELVHTILQEEHLEITDTTSLLDLKGFDSLTIVSLLEKLENQLGIEIDPLLILPETFTNSRTLAEALFQSKAQTLCK